ncbi:FRG domain-containing protein [uncultured Jatrophihabitans sp.]|uniref:FRG domain-containing protein n=1 Tax=uncultured Jatrophihabitans sp. TaxID=1610747 RepID=UPI0035CAB2BF
MDDWDTASRAINKIIDRATNARTMAWRGVVDATYSLHSSAYRRLRNNLGQPPDEVQVVNFENEVIRRARQDWRFDNLSALEILAHIQHYGGPTRLLDVTYNPFVALWFSVERKYDENGVPRPDVDGRLFAFDVSHRQVDLDAIWSSRDLPWKSIDEGEWRRFLPRVWRPPGYNERISAQNSAFLLGGVPMIQAGDNSRLYRKRPGHASTMGLWSSAEVREATSIPVRMNSLTRRARVDATPTYTLRVAASAKPELRFLLEKRFGYNQSTLYPDLFGLAGNVAHGIEIA